MKSQHVKVCHSEVIEISHELRYSLTIECTKPWNAICYRISDKAESNLLEAIQKEIHKSLQYATKEL